MLYLVVISHFSFHLTVAPFLQHLTQLVVDKRHLDVVYVFIPVVWISVVD